MKDLDKTAFSYEQMQKCPNLVGYEKPSLQLEGEN